MLTLVVSVGCIPHGQVVMAQTPSAPAITSASNTTFSAGVIGPFTVTTTGAPTATVAEAGTLPSGITFVDNGNGTGTLGGTATPDSGGVYNISFTAQNGIAPAAMQSFALTVDQAPVITSAANAAFSAGAPGSFTVTTTAFPKAGITENGTLPNGVTFVANADGTGTLAGTATVSGAFPISFTAANGIGSNAVQDFALTVGNFATTTALTSSLNPVPYGQSVNFSAAVTSSACTPAGTVVFRSGGSVLGKVTLAGGSATLSTASLNPGARNIAATYTGSKKCASSVGSLTETVQKASTTTSITSAAPSPSSYDQTVAFSASVATAVGTPTGSVTFKLGATVLGSAALAGAAATYTTAATQIPTGTDSITAHYAGDSDHAASVSSVYSQTVGKAATNTTLASSQNPSTLQQSVTLTATVSAQAGTPAGNVVFWDGAALLGTVALAGGTAAWTTSFGTAGSHNLTAHYNANKNYIVSTGPAVQTVQGAQGAPGQIQHIVVIFQENRTPDNLFQDPVLISRGADIATSGINSQGQMIPLSPIDLGTSGANPQNYDLNHGHHAFVTMYDGGRMDHADLVGCIPSANCPPNAHPNPQYAYVEPGDVQPYFALAEQYTFGDRMFQTNQGPSFPAHQFIFAGTSAPTATSPLFASENMTPANGDDAGCMAPSTTTVTMIDAHGSETSTPPQYPCFEHPTLTDLLEATGLTWRYYTPSAGSIWTAPDAIEHICQQQSVNGSLACMGTDWTNNVIIPQSQVLTDIAAGELAQVTWVIPDGVASDHPGVTDGSGPSWVASVVNAIGNSTFWANTAIIITWDDWGGWYDHVAPTVINDGVSWGSGYVYGFRVPLIVASPYAKAGYVSHTTHDFGSILRFIEGIFSLPSLGYADAQADDLADCFDFSQAPIQYVPLASKYNAAYFIEHGKTDAPTDPDDD